MGRMADQLRDLVRTCTLLFNKVPKGHPWHSSERRHTTVLAALGFTTPLPGLASRPELRFPNGTKEIRILLLCRQL